ncbi:hypothetical protein GCM10011316_02160 [Roseibium aquae]|uniref:Uncharacterized protein n=1 Tax=Roseibium aquae TaxID=1323746 RepID=A0A916T6L6_9HYPH|nr:hypothetical protein [Roseibium aquae]GGB33641.1 hypothetical protein GCM10011316_02160 [Roseibium aquae]
MLPAWFDRLVISGDIVLIASAVIVVEAVLIALFRKRLRAPMKLLLTLGAGFALLGALHAALSGAGTVSIVVWLLFALTCHTLDLTGRLFPKPQDSGRT